MHNEFVLFVGPMFGGKTTKLLSTLDRYKYQGKNLLTFKPNIDQRYSDNEIVTHWNARVPAKKIKCGADIISHIENSKKYVIAVDEAFMIPNIGETLISLYRAGHTVVVSSLQLSSDFTPYAEIQAMMPYATRIELCPAVCAKCDKDAHYTIKIGGRSDHAIEVGGADMYQPVCLEHFIEFETTR